MEESEVDFSLTVLVGKRDKRDAEECADRDALATAMARQLRAMADWLNPKLRPVFKPVLRLPSVLRLWKLRLHTRMLWRASF